MCLIARFHWLILKSAQVRFSCHPHTLTFLILPREVKIYSTKHVRYFPHGLVRQNSHTIFTAHVRKQLSEEVHEAEISAISSSVRQPLIPNHGKKCANGVSSKGVGQGVYSPMFDFVSALNGIPCNSGRQF